VTRGDLSGSVIADRVQWVETMLARIRELPVEDAGTFFADSRNVLACESCLRRALETMLDLDRYILAKRFGVAVEEYKEIGPALAERQVITEANARLFRIMAGYRNRMVHFYHEVSGEEIREICADNLGDVEAALDAVKQWIARQKGS